MGIPNPWHPCPLQVHIYRLVSDNTIEENILRKSDQKRQLDFLAIQSAGFTTDFLQARGRGRFVDWCNKGRACNGCQKACPQESCGRMIKTEYSPRI